MYLSLCSKSLAAAFRSEVINSKDRDASTLTPVRQVGEHTFVYLRSSNVYLLAITKSNSNAMLIFQFLSRVRKQQFALLFFFFLTVVVKPTDCR